MGWLYRFVWDFVQPPMGWLYRFVWDFVQPPMGWLYRFVWDFVQPPMGWLYRGGGHDGALYGGRGAGAGRATPWVAAIVRPWTHR